MYVFLKEKHTGSSDVHMCPPTEMLQPGWR